MNTGTLYYNGFYFPEAIEASLSQRPIMETSGRVVKYVEYTLTVEFVIYPGVDDTGFRYHPLSSTGYGPLFPSSRNDIDGLDEFSGIGLLRRLLSQNGGALIFNDKGMGRDFSVSGNRSVGTRHIDVNYGPKPAIKSWKPIHANKAILIIWEVVFQIPECGYQLPVQGGEYLDLIAEFGYSIRWGINVSGLTTRTVTGQLEVLVEREGTKLLSNADQYRDRLLFTIPDGYQRQNQSWDLSDDRRFLRFSITDVEHPSDNPLYPGVVRCNVRQRVSSANSLVSGTNWNVTISGSIEVAAGIPRWWAWMAFLEIVRDRRDQAKKHGQVIHSKEDRTEDVVGNKPTTTVLTTKIEIEEEIFGRSMSFTVSWALYCTFQTLFKATGLWRKVDNAGWDLYRVSMSSVSGAWGPRGVSQLRHLPQNDAIVGFCSRGDPTILGNEPKYGAEDEKHTLFSTPCPSAADSILVYAPWAELIEDTQRVIHYQIGDTDNPNPPEFTNDLTGDGLGSDGSNYSSAPIYQQRGSSKFRVIFRGYAIRVGFTMPRVTLMEYGGAKAFPIGMNKFSQKLWKTVDGCKVYIATWEQEYYLADKPQGRLMETNPDPRLFNQ